MSQGRRGRVPRIQGECSVCGGKASGNNYNCYSCTACKEFFKRTITLGLQLNCRRGNMCYSDPTPRNSKCKHCRFVKCMTKDMFVTLAKVSKFKGYQTDTLESTVGQLRYLDTRRTTRLMSKINFENPHLIDVVRRDRVRIIDQPPEYEKTFEDWQHLKLLTTIEFLKELDFMPNLEFEDQMTLIRGFAAKADLMFTSLRSMRSRFGQIMTPGGHEIVPTVVKSSDEKRDDDIDPTFREQIRSRLLGKLIELEISDEEFLLVLAVLFCDPMNLEGPAQATVAKKRDYFASHLLQYCQLQNEENPARYIDLLNIAGVLWANMTDIHDYATIVTLTMTSRNEPLTCKNLHIEVMS